MNELRLQYQKDTGKSAELVTDEIERDLTYLPAYIEWLEERIICLEEYLNN